MRPHRAGMFSRVFVWSDGGQPCCRRCAPRHQACPLKGHPQRVCVKVLALSPEKLLKDLIVECEARDSAPKPGILLLDLLHPLCLANPHAAILFMPTKVCLLVNADRMYSLSNRLALAQPHSTSHSFAMISSDLVFLLLDLRIVMQKLQVILARRGKLWIRALPCTPQ